jgi:hypothetical protein
MSQFVTQLNSQITPLISLLSTLLNTLLSKRIQYFLKYVLVQSIITILSVPPIYTFVVSGSVVGVIPSPQMTHRRVIEIKVHGGGVINENV